MAWQFKSDWVSAPRNPTYADLQALMYDQGRAGVGSWGGDVDAGGFRLLNLGGILSPTGNFGFGTNTVPYAVPVAGRAYVTIKGASEAGVLELATGTADADGVVAGALFWSDPINSQTDKRLALVNVARAGTTANNRGGVMSFYTRPDAATIPLERMRIDRDGKVGIGTANPTQLLTLKQLASGGVGPIIQLENSSGAVHDAGAIQLFDNIVRGQLRMSVEAAPWGADFIFLSGAAGATEVARITSGGNVGIGTASPTAPLHVFGLATHASNAAAISAGKTAGAFYTDGAGNVKVVY